MSKKRSARCILTIEARVLKEMRVSCGYTMRHAGELLGLSDSYIAHLETGRMDVPKGEKLERILNIYGGIKIKSFYEKVRNFQDKLTPREELIDEIKRLSDQELLFLLRVVRGIV